MSASLRLLVRWPRIESQPAVVSIATLTALTSPELADLPHPAAPCTTIILYGCALWLWRRAAAPIERRTPIR